jgi:hypothetical protein
MANEPYGSGAWSGWESIYSRARRKRDSGTQNYLRLAAEPFGSYPKLFLRGRNHRSIQVYIMRALVVHKAVQSQKRRAV